MKTLTGIVAGITLVMLWHILGYPLLGWLMIRVAPPTPDDWVPKHRTWKNGVLQ